MNVIAKISCYFERSIVTLKMRKEYFNTDYSDIQYVSLTPNKIMNSLIHRTLFYVNIYRSYKLSKSSPVFGPPCISKVIYRSLQNQTWDIPYILHWKLGFGIQITLKMIEKKWPKICNFCYHPQTETIKVCIVYVLRLLQFTRLSSMSADKHLSGCSSCSHTYFIKALYFTTVCVP